MNPMPFKSKFQHPFDKNCQPVSKIYIKVQRISSRIDSVLKEQQRFKINTIIC